MTTAPTQVIGKTPDQPLAAVKSKPPRLWPALLLVVLYWTGWVAVTPLKEALGVTPFMQFMYYFWAPMIIAVLMLLWALALSRLTWLDRFWFVGTLALGGIAAMYLVDRSVLFGLIMYALPIAMTAAVVWLVVMRGAATWTVRLGLVAASVLSWGYYTLVRVDGIDGDLAATRNWRWEPTPEQRYLLELKPVSNASGARPASDAGQTTESTGATEPSPPQITAADLTVSAGDWPEFRGAARDGTLRGASIAADWKADPPKKIWSRRVGPGWSSFVTVGDVAFTQEQRGEHEAVVCFDIATGHEIWSHTDKARFWEVVAGAGPRSTPTLAQGKLYTQGASGVLDCLDGATGDLVWSRDIKTDAGVKDPPAWGYSSSPLVAQGSVITFAGGKDGKSVLAYDAATGEPRWHGGKGTHSYSSPHLATIAGVEQVLMVSDHGLESFDPASGQLLWDHKWFLEGMFRVNQPLVLQGDKVLISTGMSMGSKLLAVTKEGDQWQVKEEWFTKDYSPYFNDAVVHDGYLYGFDGPIFLCVDLATGKKLWKKGRYGHGQVLLVADQGLLVIISEKGELALVEANPKDLKELSKFQAIKGKTWNHPVITGNRLLVRNDEEMACFEVVGK
jgi:outer membrane protein assembly factor BamB